MKYIINIFLIALVGLLAYMLFNSIKEPIAFGDEKQKRKGAVVAQLENIRKAQEVHRLIKGEFAGSFDDLVSVLTNDSIPTIKLTEDPNDPTNRDKFLKETTYSPAIDSIGSLGIVLEGLGKIPYTEGRMFEIQADTVTYQKTNVAVVEVGTKWKEFMGKYADPRYAKYDSKYDPNRTIKFGDMNKPSLSGSWDR